MFAIDQSYTRTGISIVDETGIVFCKSIQFTGCKTKSEKRALLYDVVDRYIEHYKPDVVVVERVRTFSKGFMSTATILALGSLVTTVVDASSVSVYSVDTRAWKSKVLNDPSASKDDAVQFVAQLGLEVDHDAADSLCMALYALQPGARLKKEE